MFLVYQIFAANPQSYEEYENDYFWGAQSRRALTPEEKQRCQASYQTYLQKFQESERQNEHAINKGRKNLKSKLAAAADSSMPTFDWTHPIPSLNQLYKSFESDKNQTLKSIKSANKLTTEIGAGLLDNAFWDDGSTLVTDSESQKRAMVQAKLEEMTIEKGKQYQGEILKFMLQELHGLNLSQIAILGESIEEEYGGWRKYFDTRFRIYLKR
jgi:hypothetical protein